MVAAAEAAYAPLRAASPELAKRLVGLIPQARLNTSLYEDQIRVSFLVNYFKRPWAIDGMVAAYLKCREVVPSELVVNVDNPEEAAEWVKHVYSSEGFVVPVFSYNLHEARGYNRAARTAKGDIIIIMQVRPAAGWAGEAVGRVVVCGGCSVVWRSLAEITGVARSRQ